MKYIQLMMTLSIMLASGVSLAAGTGHIGFKLEIDVAGWFDHSLTKVLVKDVMAGSAAEQAGIAVGEQIVAIEGCKIPGCDGDKAKKMLAKHPGESVHLSVKNNAGEVRQVTVVLQ